MESLDIPTSQQVVINYDLATLGERAGAFLADLFLWGFIYYLIVTLLSYTIGDLIQESGMGSYFVYALMPIFLLLVYHLAFELWNTGQSPGKRMLGLRVVRLDGREPRLSDFLLRAVFLLVDVVLSLGMIASILVSTSSKRQRLGDMTAQTAVVRMRSHLRFQLKDIVRIDALENYSPVYPQVRQLNEPQMLLIKNTLARYQDYGNPAHQEILQQLVAQLTEMLDIRETPEMPTEFLKTLIKDYILLTR